MRCVLRRRGSPQDTGIAAGMLVAIHQDLGHTLSATEQEVIVSSTTLGAIIGALIRIWVHQARNAECLKFFGPDSASGSLDVDKM